jgi:hypothetical protein
VEWIKRRIDYLKEPQRTIERARVHLGHVGAGFAVPAIVVIVGGPLWLATIAAFAWIIGVESFDTIKYHKRFPWPWFAWSRDSKCDVFQLLGGASFVLIGWWFFLIWLVFYFILLPEQI